jgi:predicted HTH domain antitoxin
MTLYENSKSFRTLLKNRLAGEGVTMAKAAEMLGMSPQQFNNWFRNRGLPLTDLAGLLDQLDYDIYIDIKKRPKNKQINK